MLVRRELLIQDEFPSHLLVYLTAEGSWVPCPDELAVNLPTAVAEMLVNSLNREAKIDAVVKGWGPMYKYSCEYPNPIDREKTIRKHNEWLESQEEQWGNLL